jgi:hypothetical protein
MTDSHHLCANRALARRRRRIDSFFENTLCHTLLGRTMPLTRNIKEVVFDPEAIELMVTVFKTACLSLQLVDRDTLLTQIIARNVVEIAATGERDPERLRDQVLLALKESDRRSA